MLGICIVSKWWYSFPPEREAWCRLFVLADISAPQRFSPIQGRRFCWGGGGGGICSIPCGATILSGMILKNWTNSSFSFKSSWCNSTYYSNISSPQTEVTTFAFSSVFILLLFLAPSHHGASSLLQTSFKRVNSLPWWIYIWLAMGTLSQT